MSDNEGWFGKNWDVIGVLRNIKEYLSDISGWKAYLVAPLILLIDYLIGIVEWFVDLVNALLAQLDALLAQSISIPGWDSGSIASDVWAFANAFLPLDLAVQLIGLYFGLLLTCVALRILKSFVFGMS